MNLIIKKLHIRTLLLTSIITLLSACSFVSLDPQAKDVMVSPTTNELSRCKFLGKTTVSLWAKAENFQSQDDINDQLNTLARNQATKMGGNAVTPDSKINNGQRTYRIYTCSNK